MPNPSPTSPSAARRAAADLPACGLSVDVEDYFQVEAFSDRVSADTWPSFPRRVADSTRRVLDVFARYGAKGTFFVLGWVAEREPKLVEDIVSGGHEIACHSYLHRCIWRLKPEEFREDTRRAVDTLESAAGRKLKGYRAPTFSIIRKSLWALEILAEHGFQYDSSVYPVRHDVYGMPDAPRSPFRWDFGNGSSLFEIPMTTVRFMGMNLAAGGGGYLRILPMAYTRWAMRRAQREGQRPVVYFHPWEIDPGQPRLAGRVKSVFRHYFNQEKMEGRIVKLLEEFKFVPLQDYLRSRLEEGPVPGQDPESMAGG